MNVHSFDERERETIKPELKDQLSHIASVSGSEELRSLAMKAVEEGLNDEEVQHLYDFIHRMHVRLAQERELNGRTEYAITDVELELEKRGATPQS